MAAVKSRSWYPHLKNEINENADEESCKTPSAILIHAKNSEPKFRDIEFSKTTEPIPSCRYSLHQHSGKDVKILAAALLPRNQTTLENSQKIHGFGTRVELSRNSSGTDHMYNNYQRQRRKRQRCSKFWEVFLPCILTLLQK